MPVVSRSRAAQNAAEAAANLTKPKELAEVTNASIKPSKKTDGKGKADQQVKAPSTENISIPAQKEEKSSKPASGKGKHTEAVTPIDTEISGNLQY